MNILFESFATTIPNLIRKGTEKIPLPYFAHTPLTKQILQSLQKSALVCLMLLSTSVQADETITFASGQQQIILIELYTSEGCSSCPPADAWLTKLKNDPRLWNQLIPIAFHVDYWDYIGWKDPFAKPAHSLRQRQHLIEANADSVYTPQFMIAGKEWQRFFFSDSFPVDQNMKAGILKAVINGEKLSVSYEAEHLALDFNIAILGFDLHSEVKKGENAGRLLQHNFVVLDHQIIQSDNNQVELNLNNKDSLRDHNYGIVIWVSKQNSLIPIQAVGGRLGR